jgi:hypothetical protein
MAERRHSLPRAFPPRCEFEAAARNGIDDAERFVGGQIRGLTPQWCLGDRNPGIQKHGEVPHST